MNQVEQTIAVADVLLCFAVDLLVDKEKCYNAGASISKMLVGALGRSMVFYVYPSLMTGGDVALKRSGEGVFPELFAHLKWEVKEAALAVCIGSDGGHDVAGDQDSAAVVSLPSGRVRMRTLYM